MLAAPAPGAAAGEATSSQPAMSVSSSGGKLMRFEFRAFEAAIFGEARLEICSDVF